MNDVPRVKRVRSLDGFRLYVEFADGLVGQVDLSERLFGPLFEPLRDWKEFSKAYVDDFGAVCWPNGADLAPDALYERVVLQCEAGSRRLPT
jgi:Protein of unknown function (DUF2442)